MKKGLLRFAILMCVGFVLGGIWGALGGFTPKDEKDISKYIKTANPLTAGFDLVHGDKSVTEQDWADQKHLVFFGFTHCPDICPVTLEKLSTALDDSNVDVPVLFITVDPERDTPEIMTKYAAAMDARIVGLTGTRAQIDATINNYKVYAAKDVSDVATEPHMYMMQHSSFIYLMDKGNLLIKAISSDSSVTEMAEAFKAFLYN